MDGKSGITIIKENGCPLVYSGKLYHTNYLFSRRPGATPRLSHEFKDVRIKPRGKGFVNQGQVSSSPLPGTIYHLIPTHFPEDGYQTHSSMEDPSLSALLTATHTAGYPNENYVSSKTGMKTSGRCVLIGKCWKSNFK